MKKVCMGLWAACLGLQLGFAQTVGSHLKAGAGNPIIPGYFADPTVRKFGDTYYIYATTDGNGGGNGPSQVWRSKDFVHWEMKPMNWPTTPIYWAPDVIQGNDGQYYMYYCQPVDIYGASGPTPVGPWTPLYPDGKPIVKNLLIPNIITLDGQTFRDDDGKFYMFWGTWGIYPNSGCGIGLLNDDMKTFSKFEKLTNTIARDFFEAPFLFKRKGIYYLTYSSGHCEDDTYRVQYVTSKTGPMGPFEFGKHNPILVTSADGTVHGPGHQSVIEHEGEYYLVYHRHNNPNSGGGFHRQVCADKLVFDADGNIEKVVPTHTGVGAFGPLSITQKNLALGKTVTASSFYDADFKPAYAFDDNNGTLWKPQTNTAEAWVQVDLGSVQSVGSLYTQFEYATWYYQYLWEYSVDGRNWKTYADQRANTQAGSPMIDSKSVQARYLRMTITNTEYPGINKAVWNVKVYATPPPAVFLPEPTNQRQAGMAQTQRAKGLLLDMEVSKLPRRESVTAIPNAGKLGGSVQALSASTPKTKLVAGRDALVFSGKEYLKLPVSDLSTLKGNSSFTVMLWVFNPVIADEEPILTWTNRLGNMLTTATVGYGKHRDFGAVVHSGWPDMSFKTLPEAGQWHHLALTFDGTMERLYVDGKLDREERKTFFIEPAKAILLGTNADQSAFFSGALASVQLYDIALTEAAIQKASIQKSASPIAVSLDAASLAYGSQNVLPNEGYSRGVWKTSGPAVTVKDVHGKIAFEVSDQTELSLPAPALPQGYSAVLSVFEKNAWHQVVLVSDGKSTQTYTDGRLEARSGIDPFHLKNLTFSSLEVFHSPFTAATVATRYAEWKRSFQKLNTPSFAMKPTALTPQSVQMQAAGQGLQYWFETTEGGHASGWIDDPNYTAYGLNPDQTYSFRLKVRDDQGNVSAPSAPVEVSTRQDQFQLFQPAFGTSHNFLTAGVGGTGWDGIVGDPKNAEMQTKDGRLRFESKDTKWDGEQPRGPFLYKTIAGDFVAQVEIAEVKGQNDRKNPGANDAGLMVRLEPAGKQENLIQNSIFPGWGVGNLVTHLSEHGRQQTNNQSAWAFDRYLQIQRRGNVIELRSSSDGTFWKSLPGSPITKPDWDGKPLQVGVFQATYGSEEGLGVFRNFKIIRPQ